MRASQAARPAGVGAPGRGGAKPARPRHGAVQRRLAPARRGGPLARGAQPRLELGEPHAGLAQPRHLGGLAEAAPS